MFAKRQAGSARVLLCAVLFLSGCQSIGRNVQYVPPKADEPAAFLRIDNPKTGSVGVISLNENDCWVGATLLPYDPERGARVGVGKQLVVGFTENVGGNRFCSMTFALTPEVNANYLIKIGTWSETRKALIPLLAKPHEQGYCGVVVFKQVAGQLSIEPVPQMIVDKGLMCYKYVKKKPRPHTTPQ